MIPALVKQLGNSNNKSAGTTLAHTFAGATSAGNLIVAWIIFDNAATASKPVVSSITKMAGETASWVFLGAARSTSTSAGAFASGEVWCIQTTVNWSAAAYTVTLDTSVTQKAVAFTEFSGASATQRSTAGTNYSTTTTAASAATTGTTPQTNDLALGFVFQSNSVTNAANDTDTTSGSWSAMSSLGFGSTGGNVATNNWGNGTYKVLTSGAHQTLNSSAALTAGNGAVVAILQFIPDPTLTQAAYRFYGDGTETGSTALAAQDTAYGADVSSGDVNLQLRTRMQVTANAGQPGDDYQLQYEKNASGIWVSVSSSTDTLVDSFTNTHIPQTWDTSFLGTGQAVSGVGANVSRIQFILSRIGTPTGNVTARIYEASTGTFGSNIRPVTSAPVLATSTTSVVASSLPTSDGTYQEFSFNGTFLLDAAKKYALMAVVDTLGDGSNSVRGHVNTTTATHGGNSVDLAGAGTWSAWATEDVPFRLYVNTSIVSFNSTNLTDGAATTNRLTGGTGSFVAGKVSEAGSVDDLVITTSNYTELLYSLTLKKADLVNSDTLRFRVLRNGATTGLTYSQTPTINVTKAASKIATLTDSFDTAIDAAKWTTSGTPTPVVESGQLRIQGSGTGMTSLISANLFDLTESSAYAKIVLPTLAYNSTDIYFSARDDAGSNGAYFLIFYTTASGGYWEMFGRSKEGGVDTDQTPRTTAPANTLWIRIRHTAGTLYFDYSLTGTSGWTTIFSKSNAATSLNAVRQRFAIQESSTEAGNAILYADNYNVAPAATGRPKIWTGSAWQNKPAKVYMGAGPGWQEKPMKRWDGSAWKTVT